MTRQKATPEAVDAATQTLREQGIEPTADRIVEITGGSKSTVLKQLSANAAAQKTPPRPIPEKIENWMREAVFNIWTHATELADKDIFLIKGEAQDEVISLQEQLECERKNVQRLQKDLEVETDKLEAFRKLLAEQTVKLEQAENLSTLIEELKVKVEDEKRKATEHQLCAAKAQGALDELRYREHGRVEPTTVT